MGSMQGKVAIVTGANTGIGRETALELARQGAQVFLACRSQAKTQPVVDEINRQIHDQDQGKAEFLPLDLGSFDSVRRCAELFLQKGLPLHVLVNNAGLAGNKGLTDSGFEMTFGVCHMGHFLLTNLLLDTLKQSAPARIVVVSSKMHKGPKRFNFAAVKSPTKSWNGVPEYGQAKLANVLFVKALAKRLEGTGVNVYALHPGVVASDVWRALPWPLDKLIKPFMLSTAEGAKTSLYCAMSDAAAGQSGLYYDECKVAEPSALALDEGLAEELWSKSEGWVEAASR
ncbi:MAG: SDR family oxidoreductase [Pseudomonadales bacterium]|mgnify:CR=1 FL=1|nr:SDR family oxidoreductase [Pseudomonadales bacterium]MAQ26809.1 SDR family oxidoreductase [Pseudomonadales bacterium]HAU13217.1 SDR family oxidoreductase [Gammaproteobacteria bacterium]|tara:strand:- start:9369 stop:10226 length:858 start_codon:yes stop_codon:yes gene_type:complete